MLYAKLSSPDGDTISAATYRALPNRIRVEYAPLDELSSGGCLLSGPTAELPLPLESTEELARQYPSEPTMWASDTMALPSAVTRVDEPSPLAKAIAFRRALQSMSLTVIDGVTVDVFTSNIVVTVLDHLSTEKKVALCRKPVRQICSLALRMVA